MHTKLSYTAATVLVLLMASARAEESIWSTDFAAAKAKAKAEKKLMLLDFTGSDWCGWCIKLHKEVFDLEAFKTEAPKKFVLVELDFPQTKKLPVALRTQNDKLQNEYKIEGFPTIVMTDPEGKTYARLGYSPGGPEKYLKELTDAIAAHDKLVALQDKLSAAKGLDRAKTLDQILVAQEKLGLEGADDDKYAAEILTLDPDNKAGLKSKYTIKKLLAEAEEQLAANKFAAARATCEKALAVPGIAGEQKQEAWFAKGICCQKDKDYVGLVACLTQARDAAPASARAEDINTMIKRNQPKADAQAAINKLKDEAKAAKGLDRAKLLDQLVEAQTKFLKTPRGNATSPEIAQWSAEIITLDADNKAGLKTKYELKAHMAEANKQFKAKKYAEAKEAVTKALALPGLTEEQKAPALKLQKDLESAKAN